MDFNCEVVAYSCQISLDSVFNCCFQVVGNRALATVVISDSMPPNWIDQLAMVLRGGSVMESSLLLDGKGALMTFKACLANPKWVHVTEGFKCQHKGAFDVIRS